MRVAIDARPALDPTKTGVGYYTQQLIRGLPLADPELQVTAWYLHAKGLVRPRRFFEGVGGPNFVERSSPFPARLFEPLSSRLGVPRLEWFVDFDVLVATNFLPPATRSRGVVPVVHDLAFRRLPETAPQVDERWLRRFRRWLRASARIIVPSEATKADLVEMEHVPGEKVDVVHHGVDAVVRPPDPAVAASIRRRLGVRGPYLLFVGGIEPRKNLPALVRAFARAEPDASLVIAGGQVRWFPKAVRHLRAVVDSAPERVRRRVLLTGYVTDAEKAALLAGAAALAYPSLHEGFGLPVLEAMSAGVPVMTSNVSALPEIAGDAALLVDPHDVASIAQGIASILGDEELRRSLGEAGPARAASFTWEETARRTAQVLRRAAG